MAAIANRADPSQKPANADRHPLTKKKEMGAVLA